MQRSQRLILILLVIPFALIFTTATPSAGEETKRTHSVTIADYFTQGHITECEISPNGQHVAYVERRWGESDVPGNVDIWLVDSATKRTERLTFDPGPQMMVKWAPDGKSLFFRGTFKRPNETSPPYNDKAQVWRLHIESTRITPVTFCSDGISAFEVGSGGDSVYYVESVPQPHAEWAKLKKDFKNLVYGEGASECSRLCKVNLTNWRVETLYDQNRYIHSMSVSPDETRIALITTPDSFDVTHEGSSQVDILTVKSGHVIQIPDSVWRANGPSPYGWLESPCWSSSGEQLAFAVYYDGYPSELIMADVKTDDVNVRKTPRLAGEFIRGGIQRGTGDEFCYLVDDHAVARLMSVTGLGTDKLTTKTLTAENVNIDAYGISPDGTHLALLQTELDYSRDVFLWDRQNGKPAERLTTVNPQIDTWKLPTISRVKWKGAEGDEVEGILELPPDHKPGTLLPMVVCLHGGPTACDYYGFQFWIYGRTQLSTSGYAVFCPNYRGSTGYGDDFLTNLIGRENQIEVEDIMRGIDHLIAEQIADPERLGVMGWSNGGYLTNCLITHSDRFRAASSGAGMSDMTIQWSEGETPGHVVNYQRGLPWTSGDQYDRSSPLRQIQSTSFKTPLLLHAPGADTRVPPINSRALYRVARRYLNSPAELVTYPGAGHTLNSYQHRLAKMTWEQAWFDKYLKSSE
ncbi:S9 family peptidase [Schlesneria sp. T3-172]|uniref:S9 family peptidase n=3 Tax=Schlesneria TaxID=656899 RepID=UPI0037C522DC